LYEILTGSRPDRRVFAADQDTTCRNWTSSKEGAAIRGHHDRQGMKYDDVSKSWNSSHQSRGAVDDVFLAARDQGVVARHLYNSIFIFFIVDR